MKKYILLLFVFISITKFYAQPPLYNDLLILFVDGNYKKLAAKAEKYTLKEETKNDPYTYLWTSKALFKISQMNDNDEMYKNAYKDCISFMAKCIKKDKNHEVYDKEKDFIFELKNSMIENTINEYVSKNYKKAQDYCKKLVSIFPDDVSTKFMDAVCRFQNKDIPGANTIWNENQRAFELINNIDNLNDKEKEFLRLAVIESMKCLKENKQVDRAKNIGEKAKKWFSDDDFNTILKGL
jgi:hypothetical protein